MNSILRDIQRVEACQGWRASGREARAALRNSWDFGAWARAVASMDALGELNALAQYMADYRERVMKGPREHRSYWFYMKGRHHQSLGEYSQALCAYMRACGQDHSPSLFALPVLQTGTINVFLGNPAEAYSNLSHALACSRKSRDRQTSACALDFLACLDADHGAVPKARERLSESRDMAADNKYRLTWLNFTEGRICIAAGNVDEGLALFNKALATFMKTGAVSAALHVSARLASELITLRRHADAVKILQASDKIAIPFRFNVARLKCITLSAVARCEIGEISRTERDNATSRAKILLDRGRKQWSALEENNRVLTSEEVEAYVRSLDPARFERLCKCVLEEQGMVCRLTGVNQVDYDIIAREAISGGHIAVEWGVSCKRWVERNIGERDLPTTDSLRRRNLHGLILMTTGNISSGADEALGHLRNSGLIVSVWTGERLVKYLLQNDWILAIDGII